jgi:hypothetical protein
VSTGSRPEFSSAYAAVRDPLVLLVAASSAPKPGTGSDLSVDESFPPTSISVGGRFTSPPATAEFERSRHQIRDQSDRLPLGRSVFGSRNTGYFSVMTTPHDLPSQGAVPGPGGFFEPDDDANAETEEPETITSDEDDERHRRENENKQREEDIAP